VTFTRHTTNIGTAVKEFHGKKVAMDCPYTGKGEEFSPTNLIESALGVCMLLSMSTAAIRHEINLTDTRVDVSISSTNQSKMRFKAIDIAVTMPSEFTPAERVKLEQAAVSCPIKHSFADEIPINARYVFRQKRGQC